MRTMCKRMLETIVVLGALLPGIAISAQSNSERSVDQFTCKDIMRESGPNRDTAIAFAHGYLLGKSGSSTFNTETLEKQTDAFIERCLDNPGEKALDAMIKVKR
jgi:HdeA/HdeB family